MAAAFIAIEETNRHGTAPAAQVAADARFNPAGMTTDSVSNGAWVGGKAVAVEFYAAVRWSEYATTDEQMKTAGMSVIHYEQPLVLARAKYLDRESGDWLHCDLVYYKAELTNFEVEFLAAPVLVAHTNGVYVYHFKQ